MFCMNCGQQLPEGAKFCMKCGTPQGAVSPTGTMDSEPKSFDHNQTFVPAMCPNCNAHMQVNPSYRMARCSSCGTECLVQDAVHTLNVTGSVNVVHSGVVIQKHERVGEPNLHISYTSTIPSVSMSINISPEIRRVVFLNGTSQSFTLAHGIYLIEGSVGSFLEKVHESFTRRIEINDEHPTVTISVSVKPGFIHSVYVNVF